MAKEEPSRDEKRKKGRPEDTPEQIDAEIQAMAERGYEVAMRKLRERAAEAREAKDFARAKRLDEQIRRLEH